MSFTPTQWETMRDSVHDFFINNGIASKTSASPAQWEEARRLLLSHEPWPLYHHLAEQEGDKITMKGILVDVSISSLLCDLCRRKSANDKARFNLAKANHLAKTQKQKTARMVAARANAKKNKGKGRADGPTDPVPSPARKRTKTAHNPFTEEEEYDLEEFLPSEDDEELGQGPPAEEASGSQRRNRMGKKKGEQRRNEEQAEEEAEEEVVEEEDEIDELYSWSPSKQTWEAYRYEKLPKLDSNVRGTDDDQVHPAICHLIGALVPDHKFSKVGLFQGYFFRPSTLQVIFLLSKKDVWVWLNSCQDLHCIRIQVIYHEEEINGRQTPPPSLYLYFMGDWETVMDIQLRNDRRSLSFTKEEQGNDWAIGKRKRPKIIDLSDDNEDGNSEEGGEDEKMNWQARGLPLVRSPVSRRAELRENAGDGKQQEGEDEEEEEDEEEDEEDDEEEDEIWTMMRMRMSRKISTPKKAPPEMPASSPAQLVVAAKRCKKSRVQVIPEEAAESAPAEVQPQDAQENDVDRGEHAGLEQQNLNTGPQQQFDEAGQQKEGEQEASTSTSTTRGRHPELMLPPDGIFVFGKEHDHHSSDSSDSSDCIEIVEIQPLSPATPAGARLSGWKLLRHAKSGTD
ncbi:hypothetical protein DFP73DRAFT_532544 [Morchella snyderi]|nr:hypothetical protein DFP73DRAFT_532544 [Morchella snyderi]